MLSHDTWKNMKRIGIKGSHLAFFFNFGGRDSLKMIYKANYFIFPFNMIIGGRGEGENFLSLLKFRIQTGHPKETKAVCLHLKVPASPPRLPGSRAPTAPRSWPWSCSEGAESLSRVRLLVTPPDCSPPASSVHGILQARTLECVAVPSSRGSSWPRDQTHISSTSFISWRWWAGGFFTPSTAW